MKMTGMCFAMALVTERKTVQAAWRVCLVVASFTITQPVWSVEKIVIVGLFRDKAVALIDGKRRILSVGKTTPEGVKLISASSREAILEVNGKRSPYKLGTHITTNYRDAPAGKTVQIWPNAMGMYFVNGSINDFPVKFLVDTGATLIAMNKLQAKRLGLNYKLDGAEGMTSTASGVAKAYYLKLKTVKVGDILLRDVAAAVVDREFPTEVLLGNSFLNRLDMTRDGKVMTLRKK